MEPHTSDIMALIARAPWREAVTYRDTWPHEYVVIRKDRQEELLAAFCERIERGEGVECQFFGQRRPYLFLGDHKYWIMTDCSEVDLEADDDEVLNRALLYRDRRDFLIQPGDTGVPVGGTTVPTPEEEFEQLEVRSMWKDEARNFTPWLAKNLNLLGNELGMKLELDQTEVPIGPYYLDILATDADKGVSVAIENQLGETDLGHLGQLLTYATGCGAHVAIWVATEFGYEHAQALQRLNEWTTGRIEFYGAKVEVIKRVGDEDHEPRFRKVVYPGGWNKDLTLSSREMPLRIRRYYDFFQPLIDKLARDDFSERPIQRFDHTGRHFPSRLNPGAWYAVSLEGENDAWVTLHLEMDYKDHTKRLFNQLNTDREQIKQCIDAGADAEWSWRRHDSYLFSSISIRKDGSINDPSERREETRAWMLNLLPKFKEVFDPRLKELLSQNSS